MAAIWSYVLTIALHPEVQRKGQAVVDAAVEGRLPNFTDFGTMPYVDAIVNEVFRWNPITPLGVPHVARQDDYYEGHLISKGTMVFGNIWLLLRNEQVYGAYTDKFIPERFLTKDGKLNATMDMETAFGWGRRICPGKGPQPDGRSLDLADRISLSDMAREVLWLTVASLLATFDICDPVDKDGKPLHPDNIDVKYSQRPVR
jgi:hypothetical protein